MTTRVSTCRYCGRTLPLDQFPVKPGRKNVRYKACRECHQLGHSCIPKKKPEPRRRKYATDEERKAAQLEYQRRYREKHQEKKRESNRAAYWRKKGLEPPAEKMKCGRKPKKLTDEERKASHRESQIRWNEKNRDRIREYRRKWNEENRDRVREYRRKYNQEHKGKSEPVEGEVKKPRAKRHPPFTSEEERRAHNREYQRRWHERNREKMKSKRQERHETAKSINANDSDRYYCSDCRRIMSVEHFIANGRQYKVCNECRARHTKKQELGQSAKGPHGTGTRYEYQRQYWQEHKEEIKAKRCESTDTSNAVVTDKRIVMLFEKGYSPNDISSRCRVSVEHVRQVIEREGCKSGDVRLCSDCWLYPCFEGIESLSSNLALTCQKYHRKEAAS